MTSSLPNFKAALRADWEAAIPPADGSGALYRCMNTLAEHNTSGLHRQFKFRPWSVQDLIEERDDGVQLVEWTIAVELFLHRNHREDDAFLDASTHEVSLLRHRWSGLTAWGDGVEEVQLDQVLNQTTAPNRPPRAGGVNRDEVYRLLFGFRVKCEESG